MQNIVTTIIGMTHPYRTQSPDGMLQDWKQAFSSN